mgnify:CR=1 FL=1
MKKDDNFASGVLLGIVVATGLYVSNGPIIKDVNYYDLPNGPRIMHTDVKYAKDDFKVQSPDGNYLDIQTYLIKYVDKQDRAVQRALIERIVDTKGKI